MTSLPPLRRTTALLLVVLPVALFATAFAALIGRLDTALLYVGVPCLLALAVGLVPTDADQSGLHLFQATTVAMLLIAAFMHEGALCVLIVSPLVYGLAFAVHGLTRVFRAQGRHHAFGAVVILMIVAESAFAGPRLHPDQTVSAEQLVAAECADFETSLERGPSFSPDDRGPLLRLARYPLPTDASSTRAAGSRFTAGDEWTFPMPAGEIVTRVSARDAPSAEQSGSVQFDVVSDTARTTRWVTLEGARLSWIQADDGCHARVELTFVRDLDPAFYFGPVIQVFMTAGASAFLTGLI